MGERTRFLKSDEGDRLKVVGMDMVVKASTRDTDGAYEIVIVEGSRGDGVPAHKHPWSEAYLVLDGELHVQIGGRAIEAAEGAFLTVPRNALHGLVIATDTARFLHLTMGDQAVSLFSDLSAVLPGHAGAGDVPTLIEVGARHGLEFAAPLAQAEPVPA